MKKLPWKCPKHPDAQIKHSWDKVQIVLNGYPSGTGYTQNHKFECKKCGHELTANLETIKEGLP